MMENNKGKYANGNVFTNKKGESFTIKGKLERWNYYLIEFEDGTQKEVSSSSIHSGSISKNSTRLVGGFGIANDGAHPRQIEGVPTRQYTLWSSMIYRCYSGRIKAYIGCNVDERWKYFQDFCESIKHLEGYDKWLDIANRMELDKDIKVPGNKTYGPDTCFFVEKSVNVKHRRMHTGYLVRKDGLITFYENQSQIMEYYNFTQATVSHLCTGKRIECKGLNIVKSPKILSIVNVTEKELLEKTGIDYESLLPEIKTLSVKEYAKKTKQHPKTVLKKIKKEKIPVIRKSRKDIKIKISEDDDYKPRKKYKATHEHGFIKLFDSQKKFEEHYSLRRGSVSACINGYQKSVKGWSFQDN